MIAKKGQQTQCRPIIFQMFLIFRRSAPQDLAPFV